MLLTTYLGPLISSGRDWELRFPSDITSWLGLDKEHPSLLGYGDISQIDQIFVSAMPLSNKIFVLTCVLRDEKGSCNDVLTYLRDNNISILRTDVRSLIHSVSWESIIKFDRDVDEDKIKKIEKNIKKSCKSVFKIRIKSIIYRLPSDRKGRCIINFDRCEHLVLSSYSGGSSLKISKDSMSRLRQNNSISKTKKAVLGIYSQIPIMVINLFDEDAKLVELSYELPDKIGAFQNTVAPITEVCSIIGLNATYAKKIPGENARGICSGIFCIRKDKDIYDLDDALREYDQTRMIRSPSYLLWSPCDHTIFLSGLKRILDAKWEKQRVGKNKITCPNGDEKRYHKSISLDTFKIPSAKPIDVIFVIEKMESGVIEILTFLNGMPGGVSEGEATKSFDLLKKQLIVHKEELFKKLIDDVNWEGVFT